MANFTENYDRFGIKSSTFYRLVRKDEFGKYDICDFHTVINGNMYYCEHENAELSPEGNIVGTCYHYPTIRIYDEKAKEAANKFYRVLQSKGYKCIGVFESDRCDVSKRIR